MDGKIVVFAGYAGAGKNSIIKGLLESGSGYTYIPSVTTREMRVGESEGSPYYFKGAEDFEKLARDNRFLETERIHGNWYGSLVDKYEESLALGNVILKDIGVEGALRMREMFGEDVVLVFVTPTRIEDVVDRMRDRGDREKDIQKRRARIAYEKSFMEKFDYVVVNDVLSDAVAECIGVLEGLTLKKSVNLV